MYKLEMGAYDLLTTAIKVTAHFDSYMNQTQICSYVIPHTYICTVFYITLMSKGHCV